MCKKFINNAWYLSVSGSRKSLHLLIFLHSYLRHFIYIRIFITSIYSRHCSLMHVCMLHSTSPLADNYCHFCPREHSAHEQERSVYLDPCWCDGNNWVMWRHFHLVLWVPYGVHLPSASLDTHAQRHLYFTWMRPSTYALTTSENDHGWL